MPLQRLQTQHAIAQLGQKVEHLQEKALNSQELGQPAEEQTIAEKHAQLRNHGGPVPNSFVAKIICHPRFETFGGIVVLVNFMIMTMETQANAVNDEDMLDFVAVCNRILLFYYTVECAVRVYVMKNRFFAAMWNNLDLIIVITGLISEFLEVLQVGGSGMDQIGMLKSLRMLRLIRLLRLLVAFRELYVLIAGIGRCMKTLFWASGLIFIVLNVWAILSVEYLDARVKELTANDAFTSCSWCEDAFSNIWYANLTWFQIISTADWTPIGRPLAEEFVWPYVFFVFNVFIVIWGLLNLIVAAIVDANIAAREDDVAVAAKIASQAHKEAWHSFADLCAAMDEDGSGDISVDEFKNFWRENHELQQHLTIMGVQEKDVDDLLALMDEDGSGTLEQSEFIEQFTTMRTLVEKTALYFLLKFSQSIQAKLINQSEVVQKMCEDIVELRRSTRDMYRATVTQGDSGEGSPAADEWRPVPNVSRKSFNPFKGPRPEVNTDTMPTGWYYFGASLPPEASSWCKDIDPGLDDDFMPRTKPERHQSNFQGKESTFVQNSSQRNESTIFRGKESTKRITKEVSFKAGTASIETTDGWEPVPPSGVHIEARRPFGSQGDINLMPSPEPTASFTPADVAEIPTEHDLIVKDALQSSCEISAMSPRGDLTWDTSWDHGTQEDLALTPYTCPPTRKSRI